MNIAPLKVSLLSLALLLSPVASLPAHAACTANLALQPASSLPALGGRLAYHSYMEYGDGSSNLYLHDFKSKSTRQLNQPGWNIEDPMNAHFSPDGRYLTFMGRQNGAWHVFAWAIGGTQAPSNLTAPSAVATRIRSSPSTAARSCSSTRATSASPPWSSMAMAASA